MLWRNTHQKNKNKRFPALLGYLIIKCPFGLCTRERKISLSDLVRSFCFDFIRTFWLLLEFDNITNLAKNNDRFCKSFTKLSNIPLLSRGRSYPLDWKLLKIKFTGGLPRLARETRKTSRAIKTFPHLFNLVNGGFTTTFGRIWNKDKTEWNPEKYLNFVLFKK